MSLAAKALYPEPPPKEQNDEQNIDRTLRTLHLRLLVVRAVQFFAILGAVLFTALAVMVGWYALCGGSLWSRLGFWILEAVGSVFLFIKIIYPILREPLSKEGISLRLERAFPNLDSQVISFVQLRRIGGISPDFKNAIRRDAAQRLAKVETGKVIPWKELRLAILSLCLSLACVALIQQRWPRLLRLSAQALYNVQGFEAARGLKDLVKAKADSGWAVGDIQVEYFFPSYSGLPTRKETNTDGSIKALKGTVVRLTAASGNPLKKAELVFGSGGRQHLEIAESDRKISGEFTVLQDDTYAFEVSFYSSKSGTNESLLSRRIPIVMVPDQNPQVELIEPAADLEMNEQGKAVLKYKVSDDFGLSQLKLLVISQNVGDKAPSSPENTKEIVIEKYTKSERGREATYEWDIRDLKPVSGQEIKFNLRIYDNDTISGPKFTDSASRRLTVKTVRRIQQELLAQEEKLYEILVLSLADHLELPEKLDSSGASELFADTLLLQKRLKEMLEAAQSLVHFTEQNKAADKAAEAQQQILIAGFQNLLKTLGHINDAWMHLKLSKPGDLTVDSKAQMKILSVNSDPQLERLVLDLEKTVLEGKAEILKEENSELVQRFKNLQEAFKKLSEHPDAKEMAELMKQLEAFQEDYAKHMQNMAKAMQQMPMEDFVNMDALKKMREQSMEGYMERIRKLLQAGDVEGAKKEMAALQEQMKKWMQGESEADHKKQEELSRKLMKAMEKLDNAIKGQEKLVKETEHLQQQMQKREANSKKGGYDDFLKKQLQRIQAIRGHMQAFSIELARKVHSGLLLKVEENMLGEAMRHLSILENDLKNEDLENAPLHAQDTVMGLERLKSGGEIMFRADKINEAETGARLTPLTSSITVAKEILADLQHKEPSGKSSATSGDRRQMGQLRTAQEGLRKRSLEIDDGFQEISKELPMIEKDLFGKEKDEGRFPEMKQAGERLQNDDISNALPQSRNGLYRLQDAREKLKKAMEKAQKDGKGGSGMMFLPGPMPGMPGMAGAEGRDSEKVEIPQPDQYKVPEQFRKEILDAMKKPAPKEFERLNRHYYEELVR